MTEAWIVVALIPYEGFDEPQLVFSSKEKAKEWLTAEFEAARKRRKGPHGVRRTVSQCEDLEIVGPLKVDPEVTRR